MLDADDDAAERGGQCDPVILGSVDTPNKALGVAISGSVAYVADQASGLQVIDVASCVAACPADIDDDGVVNVVDLLSLLGAWDTPGGDINGDGTTSVTDLLDLLLRGGHAREEKEKEVGSAL